MKKKIAFTLAEVLIVLGIIGIVAEMTIPTLISNVDKQVYPTQLKEVYSDVLSASKMMMADEGVSDIPSCGLLTRPDGNDTSHDNVSQFLHKYFKIAKSCEEDSYPNSCFPQARVRNLKNQLVDATATSGAPSNSVILANGAALGVYQGRTDSSGVVYPVKFLTDINGLKGPNTIGRDIFSFFLYDDGTIDSEGIDPITRRQSNVVALRNNDFNNNCLNSTSFQYSSGCFAKLINDSWKMDY